MEFQIFFNHGEDDHAKLDFLGGHPTRIWSGMAETTIETLEKEKILPKM